MTSRDFAALIGVSQSTVSRALNNSSLVSEEKRRYIVQKAREYGFVLNSQAKSLRTQRTGTVGILFPKHFVSTTTNMMQAYLYDCIQKEMHQHGYDIMVVYYTPNTDDFSSFERIIRNRKVDGFLVLRMELSDTEMQFIEDHQVPCVFLMNAGTKVRHNLNYLFSDSERGGYEVGRYLGAFTDFQKIFVTICEEHEDAVRRLEGYRRGLKSRGCELPEENILACYLGIDAAYQCILEHHALFDGKKSAIFAYNDMLALGIINACKHLGYQIPEQVQIIGMDDIPLSTQLHPTLSTLHVDVEEMVPKSCQLLIDLIDQKDVHIQEWLPPKLIPRETTL